MPKEVVYTPEEKRNIRAMLAEPLPRLDASPTFWEGHWERQADAWCTPNFVAEHGDHAIATAFSAVLEHDARLRPLLREHKALLETWCSLVESHRGIVDERGEVVGLPWFPSTGAVVALLGHGLGGRPSEDLGVDFVNTRMILINFSLPVYV